MSRARAHDVDGVPARQHPAEKEAGELVDRAGDEGRALADGVQDARCDLARVHRAGDLSVGGLEVGGRSDRARTGGQNVDPSAAQLVPQRLGKDRPTFVHVLLKELNYLCEIYFCVFH